LNSSFLPLKPLCVLHSLSHITAARVFAHTLSSHQLGNSQNSCTYPENSFPRCTAIDNAAGCNFGCDDGFKLCNGQCIGNDDTCGTQARKRDQTAAKICPKSWVACPVFFGSRTEWECVDVTGDLFSCGGCASLSGQGVDCTALPGVNDVMVSFDIYRS
jgi:hypothetical protein